MVEKKSYDLSGGFKLRARKLSLWDQFRPITRIALPLVGGLLVATYFLEKVLAGRNELGDRKGGAISKKKYEATRGQGETQPFSLEEEYEKMQAKLDLSAWENKRIPRPEDE